MKQLIILLVMFALLNDVLCFNRNQTSSVNEIVNQISMETIKMMKMEKDSSNLKSLQELLKSVKAIKAIIPYQLMEVKELPRNKRQTTSINCPALRDQLVFLQNQTASKANQLNNTIIIAVNIQNQVNNYALKISDPATNTTLNQKIYAKLVKLDTVALSLIDALKKQLADLNSTKAKIQSDIDAFCQQKIINRATNPCGVFIKFDPVNDPKGPELDGFAGGLNSDGSISYVAYGASCNGQARVPCSLDGNLVNPSCSIPCGPTQNFDKTSIFYLQKNSNLTWVSASSSTVLNIVNTVKLIEGELLMFGRALINGRYVLGKIQGVNGVFSYQTYDNGFVEYTTNFDVLTCYSPNACPATSANEINEAPAAVEAALPPCGTFLPFDTSTSAGVSALSRLGFPAGTFADGTVAYVGHGNNGICGNQNPCPGRLTDNPSRPGGIFDGCGSDNYQLNGNSFVLNHPELKWIATNVADMFNLPNVLSVQGGPNRMFYGRVIIDNVAYVSKIHTDIGDNNGFFFMKDGQEVLAMKSGFEVLTCAGPGVPQTTTTLPPPPPPTLAPCGALETFDTSTPAGISALSKYGFSAGTFSDGSVVYVGAGDNSMCGNQNLCPGRLTDNPSRPGGIFDGCGTDNYQLNGNSYMINHSNLRWIRTDVTEMMNLPYVLSVSSGSTHMYFGRVIIDNVAYVSKVHINNGDNNGFFFMKDGQEVLAMKSGFEVLTCAGPGAIQTTTTLPPPPPTIKTPPTLAPCGTFLSFDTSTPDGVSALSRLGFPAGNFADGTVAYVGHGDNGICGNQNPCPGRLTNNPSRPGGIFDGCGTDNYQLNGNSFVLNHPELKWIATNVADMFNIPNVLSVQGGPNRMFYGRVIIDNVAYVSKVHTDIGDNNGFFFIKDGQEVLAMKSGFEVLTCAGPGVSQTTTTLPPPPPPTLAPCGAFESYDTSSPAGISALSKYGFSAGIFSDGTIAYVGTGDNRMCGNQYLCPGRLTDNPTRPGGIFDGCGTDNYQLNGNSYIINHSDLRWIRTDVTEMMNLPHVLSVSSGNTFMYYGRVIIDNVAYVSKVHINNGDNNGFFFMKDGQEILAMKSGFEVLTCAGQEVPQTTTTLPPPPPTIQPSTTFAPCGTFLPFDTSNANGLSMISRFGFSAGTFADGTVAYVGHGDNGICGNQNPCPGRLTDNPSRPGGIFDGCGSDNYQLNGNSFVLNHPELKWIATNVADMFNLPNVLSVQGGPNRMFYGRVIIDNVAYVSKVHTDIGDNNGLFFMKDGQEVLAMKSGFEVLTC